MKRAVEEIPWYHRWFGEDYLLLYQHRTAAEAIQTVNWLVAQLGLQPRGRILDLACGSGRHSRELVRHGFDVVGLDLSWPLLRSARLINQVARGDMRALPFADRVFSQVLSLFTSFGYFPDRLDDFRVLNEASRVLQAGGAYVLDFLNSQQVQSETLPAQKIRLGDRIAQVTRRVNREARRVEKDIAIRDASGRMQHFHEAVNLYTLDELQEMFSRSALGGVQVFGDYLGGDYAASSPRLIMIGQKRG